MIKDVVSKLDKLKGTKYIPRGRKNKDRRREITHQFWGVIRDLLRLDGLMACLGLSLMHTFAA
jgi:hypothetical protein